MAKDRMDLLRELSAHVGRPDFAQVAERITREMRPVEVPKPRTLIVGAPRRPSTRPRRAS